MSTKKTNKILLTILPIVAVTGIILLLASKKKKHKNFIQKEKIAEEGYETAGDILFPPKNKSPRYKTEWN